MKKITAFFLSIAMAISLFSGNIFASDTREIIRWSEPETVVYNDLHPYTLNWSGDVLDRGGLNLSTMKNTTSSATADIVINQYGAMGSSGIIKLGNESLESETNSDISGFINSVTIEKGATYLVVLNDGKYAKIRIDRYLPEQGISITKVFFTYVIEKERVSIPTIVPTVPKENTNIIEEEQQKDSLDNGSSGDYKVPFSIYLSLNSKYSTIYNKNNERIEYELHANPYLYEQRTMVPLRFVAEALGAKVEWNGKDKPLIITNDDIRIILFVNKEDAIVNGNLYKLDAPAMISKSGHTMIPLRFVSEHLNMKVYFNSGMILITDTENTSFMASKNLINEQDYSNEQVFDVSGFIGKWNLWIPGSFIPNQSDYVPNSSDRTTYITGAQGGWIEIKKDGTYSWLDLGKTYHGKWVSNGKTIIVQNGPMDTDWNVRLESKNEIKIYAWGLEYKGAR